MSNYLKKILTVTISAILAAVFIIVLYFAAPKIAGAPETDGEITYATYQQLPDESYSSENKIAVIGKDVTAIRICDLHKLNKITKVNYVANKFVPLRSLDEDMQIVDLTKPFDFAEKGTLIFVIMNLDPEAEDFREQSDKLAEYKIGENWRFTVSLPKIFNASNVYNSSNLVARNGSIENYNFIEYTDTYDKKTENYSPKVKRTTVELSFHTRRHALNAYQMITVHYQSTGTVYSGITDCPLIGTEEAVLNTYDSSQTLLIIIAVFAAVVFIVLIVLSILKRTAAFADTIIWIFGIVLMMLPKFMLSQATVIPLLWSALSWSAAFFTLGGALVAIGRNFGKIPAKRIFPALMGVGGVLAFISPFVPFGAASVLHKIYLVIKAIGAVAILVFAGFAIARKDDDHSPLQVATVSVIAVGVAASVFIPNAFPVYCNSMFWLCVCTVISTFIGVFRVFYDTEKNNAYLTANLHTEVARQLKDIKAVVTERDDLLRFSPTI